ncbi:bifunctional biotin operon repressor/biotin--[acetyl-CoA-carboxylase] ligase [Actinobacillus succinogenes]|uniref:biotin--[biotin carboxyl-carrier protein] ligase n=1 Tax=Actinobacillus succinogenes (strain ATCC 55618 / DSM 22257 / CCUG 43843 / 130Z) TaxID=339671 RepID=A6VMR5_ACTSZ|nr:bifunctional biotin--[acetyl-CoA-carboxylase] ligase/biotin operon repressor BirA [Actinobacillus succinogenes]ABR74262.1 biotin--acetyl-CoA-carboxylase ligase [Actinobacillus succinogenes 130Z]PHI39310.1 bifunctional biotin operon repressor/biotin--[acetyl-CoA-carboxylase] ligase [Actinobacillus succinogenes]
MTSLLDILADCQPHSFENLTALFACSDNELLDRIRTLQEQGFLIDTGFGEIRLIPQTPLLSAAQIQQVFPHQKIMYAPVIDSTNRLLLTNMSRLNKGDICMTEYQSAGRGRRGRRWQSPFAAQAIFSMVWQVDTTVPTDGLSLTVGMAIHRAIRKLGSDQTKLKWPNDLLLHGRKLAGILIETAGTENGRLNLVIGVGINVAVPRDNNQIDQPWANLHEILPKIDRTLLLITVFEELIRALTAFERQGITPEFRQQWRQNDAFFQDEVNIITERQVISGIEQGIDERGYLRLQVGNELMTFNAGEVSLRKNVG